jgi:hypothetical protein
MRPILEAQGIQFPDIGGIMSDEERRSSLASTAGVDDHKGRDYDRLLCSANIMQPYFIGRRKLSNEG